MKTTRRIHYWLQSLDSEAAAAWAIALAGTLVVWSGVVMVAGVIVQRRRSLAEFCERNQAHG